MALNSYGFHIILKGSIMIKKMNGIMKRLILLITAFFCLGVLPCFAAPALEVKSRVYRFQPVKEGTHISHDFFVKNIGDETLEIIRVLPP